MTPDKPGEKRGACPHFDVTRYLVEIPSGGFKPDPVWECGECGQRFVPCCESSLVQVPKTELEALREIAECVREQNDVEATEALARLDELEKDHK